MRMSQRADQGRRRIQRRQPTRIIRLAGGDHASAQLCQRLPFAVAIALVRQHEILAAAALRQARQFFQRGPGGAEARDQALEGDGADMFGARQPEPGAAFIVAERRHAWILCAVRCRASAGGYCRDAYNKSAPTGPAPARHRDPDAAAGNRPTTARWRSAPTRMKCARPSPRRSMWRLPEDQPANKARSTRPEKSPRLYRP